MFAYIKIISGLHCTVPKQHTFSSFKQLIYFLTFLGHKSGAQLIFLPKVMKSKLIYQLHGFLFIGLVYKLLQVFAKIQVLCLLDQCHLFLALCKKNPHFFPCEPFHLQTSDGSWNPCHISNLPDFAFCFLKVSYGSIELTQIISVFYGQASWDFN